MRTFHCDRCHSTIYFENVRCVSCEGVLGFLPDALDMMTCEPETPDRLQPLDRRLADKSVRLCANSIQHEACNWLVHDDDNDVFCRSCRMNLLIPDLSVPGNLDRWRKVESAKRRILYTILRLNLPIDKAADAESSALRFQFVADPPDGPPLLTGHSKGVITINIAEADDVERERRRVSLGEPHRSLIGHLRHETAHYFWDHLVGGKPCLVQFREVFGNERTDYDAALKSYYQNGAHADWSTRFVSAYASSHPWEDWAETWAHYLHIVDTLETVSSFGLMLQSSLGSMPEKPDAASDFDSLLRRWLPLTAALNALNRGMGLQDFYPFVLPQPAIEKLRFIHSLVEGCRASAKRKEHTPSSRRSLIPV